jgi:hypothetical protein
MGMAEEAAATNGVSTGTPVPDAPARSSLTRAQQDAADRAAFLAADIEADVAEPAKPAKAPAKKAPEQTETDDDTAGADEVVDELEKAVEEEEEDLDLEDDAEDEDADEKLEDDEEPPKTGEDPELAKRLAQVRKQEKRVREQAADRDRAFARERDAFVAEWKPKIAEYEKFEQLKAKRSDVIAVLKAVGYSDEDFDWIAPVIHGSSKTGAADPKYRDYARRVMQERELKDDAAAARREAAEVKEMLAKRDAQAEADRAVDAYRERVLKAATDETPLLKKRLGLAPKATRAALDKVAVALAKKSGGLVNPKIVARAYEKQLRATVERAKALAAEDAPAAEQSKAKPVAKAKAPAITVVDKTKPAPTAETKAKNGLIPSREDMIARLHKLDRGELDPDAD